MIDVITIGEAMITFNPGSAGPLRFVDSFEKRVGGAELNFAIGCSRLGLKAGWISRLGNDEFGKYIKNFARGECIDVSQVKLVDDYPTSLNFKEIRSDGSAKITYYRDKSPTLTMDIHDLDEIYFQQAKILHITGIYPAIHPKNIDLIKHAIHLAKRNGLKVSFDPNIRLRMWSKQKAKKVLSTILPYVDILLAGDKEMEIILGESDPSLIFNKTQQLGISFVVIKRGEKGSIGYCHKETYQAEPQKNIKVIDTVGAGDGFNAGVIFGIKQGWSLKRILDFANTVGAMVVEVVGDNEGLPYLEDVQERLGENARIDR